MFRCETQPLGRHQFGVSLDGAEILGWNWDPAALRPYFYPLRGPSGAILTRMGHPGAPNHDHHRSVWFAQAKVMGIDFWSDQTEARIRQTDWLALHDGDQWGGFAVDLEWLDGHDPAPLLKQRLVAIVHPDEERQYQLELQSEFSVDHGTLDLMTSNFGVLAVRVARSISAYFGQGQIRCSEDRVGEEAIFGKSARWMDYSGPVSVDSGASRREMTEGITYFDHPANVSYPSKWHVREDGWMGASLCRDNDVTIESGKPLVVRYLLDVHSGTYDQDRAARIADSFSARPQWRVQRSTRKHTHAEILPGDAS